MGFTQHRSRYRLVPDRSVTSMSPCLGQPGVSHVGDGCHFVARSLSHSAERWCSDGWRRGWDRGGGGGPCCGSRRWLLIYSVYNSKADDKCPAECTCAKIFINWRPPNLWRRKTNKFSRELQPCYIFMNMQDEGWDIKIDLACVVCFLPIAVVLDGGSESALMWSLDGNPAAVFWCFWI